MKIADKIYVAVMTAINKNKIKRQKSVLEKGSRIDHRTLMDGTNLLGEYASFKSSHMGKYSYVSKGADLYRADMGSFTCVGPYVRNVAGAHPTDTFISLHPAFYSERETVKGHFAKDTSFDEIKTVDSEGKYTVKIGNDVWIGAGALLLDGITIGDGAVIGANSLVTEDIPPYAIAYGSPAKVVKYRFSEEEINKLLSLKWWNKDEDWLKENVELFKDIKNIGKLV